MIAGILAAVVLIGNIISFAGLMFPGDLLAGISTVVWSMLIGSLHRRHLDRAEDELAAARQRYRFADRCSTRAIERDGRIPGADGRW